MARIAGVNIPDNAHIVIGLQHIYGIGTTKTLAVLEGLEDNDIALFHEVAHAVSLPNVLDLTLYVDRGRAELDKYIHTPILFVLDLLSSLSRNTTTRYL